MTEQDVIQKIGATWFMQKPDDAAKILRTLIHEQRMDAYAKADAAFKSAQFSRAPYTDGMMRLRRIVGEEMEVAGAALDQESA